LQLLQLGWDSEWEQKYAQFLTKGYSVGRVFLEYTHQYKVYTTNGEMHAEVSGRIRGKAEGRLGRRDEFPAVGDWVLLREYPDEGKAIIHGILTRNSKLSRKVAGKGTFEQIIAANLDTIFILSSLNNEFNLRRIERFLVLGWESGAQPVIVLTKADLCTDIPAKVADVESIAMGVPVHVISSVQEQGLDLLDPYLKIGRTIGLLGSSGVGKSTLINYLLGENVQRVNEIRKGDDRGKHTTTHRELVVLPNGGLLIDTPGMRELQVWEVDNGLNNLYEDIIEISGRCFFKDCLHESEPGCAVKEAIRDGVIHPQRFNSYIKMQSEAADLSIQMLGNIAAVERKRGKKYAQIIQEKHSRKRK
jgi:ribosome biogenesis GTPase / thiamine phosphate phosphatase